MLTLAAHEALPAAAGPAQSLAAFILANIGPILQDWEAVAGARSPAVALGRQPSREHARDILLAVAADIAGLPVPRPWAEKSKDPPADSAHVLRRAAEQHAVPRVADPLSCEELIAEYRAVRASVLRRWAAHNPDGAGRPAEIALFNEAIDEALAASVRICSNKQDEARTVALGVLAHDLRNPMHVALLGASYILLDPTANVKCIQSAARIKTSLLRCDLLVSDLIDYACFNLGQRMPMNDRDCQMQGLCAATIDEVEAANPGRVIEQRYVGELNGCWDPARIAQLVGNLLGNALKHGDERTPVRLTATGVGDTVTVEIHNQGSPIPADLRATLFDPLYLRGGASGRVPQGSSGLGLGLYICREIALAHGGDVAVASDAACGTSFTVTLPRKSRQSTRCLQPSPAGGASGTPSPSSAAYALGRL